MLKVKIDHAYITYKDGTDLLEKEDKQFVDEFNHLLNIHNKPYLDTDDTDFTYFRIGKGWFMAVANVSGKDDNPYIGFFNSNNLSVMKNSIEVTNITLAKKFILYSLEDSFIRLNETRERWTPKTNEVIGKMIENYIEDIER